MLFTMYLYSYVSKSVKTFVIKKAVREPGKIHHEKARLNVSAFFIIIYF